MRSSKAWAPARERPGASRNPFRAEFTFGAPSAVDRIGLPAQTSGLPTALDRLGSHRPFTTSRLTPRDTPRQGPTARRTLQRARARQAPATRLGLARQLPHSGSEPPPG